MQTKTDMIQVNIFDKNFAHSINEDGFDTCSAGRKPKKIEWIRNNFLWDGITVFTDHFIATDVIGQVESKYKVAWLIEPKSIHPWTYEQIEQFQDKFDLILTHDAELLKRGPKYARSLVGSLRVKDDDRKIYPKTKNISIIASDKNHTDGHQLRHHLVSICPEIDAWGSGYKKFDSKLDPLKDYMFSVAIMNSRVNNYFTEILTDCFAVGTVPIFWGTPNVHEFFNPKGIIQFGSVEEFSKIKLSKQIYQDMLPAIEDNLDRVKGYVSTDDIIAQILTERFL